MWESNGIMNWLAGPRAAESTSLGGTGLAKPSAWPQITAPQCRRPRTGGWRLGCRGVSRGGAGEVGAAHPAPGAARGEPLVKGALGGMGQKGQDTAARGETEPSTQSVGR